MALMNKMTLLKRTLLWLSAIAIVTFITLIFIGSEVRDTLRQNGLDRTHKILLHKIRNLHIYTNERFAALHNLKQLFYFASRHHPIFEEPFWRGSPVSLQNSLKEFADKNQFYDVFVISLQGDIVYTVKHENDLHTNLLEGPYKNTELAQVFKGALNKKRSYISDFYYYEPSHDFAAFMAEPIIDNGKIIGVAAVQIDNKAIQTAINEYTELGATGEVIAVVNYQGKLMSANTTRFGEIAAYTQIKNEKMIPIAQAAMGKMGQMYTLDHFGVVLRRHGVIKMRCVWGLWLKSMKVNCSKSGTHK